MTTKARQILRSPISHCRFSPVSSHTSLPIPVLSFDHGSLSGIQTFREQAFTPEVPIHLKILKDSLPPNAIHQKLKKYKSAVVQYEYRSGGKPAEQRAKEISFLASQSREGEFQLPHDIDEPGKEFHRFYAPIGLLQKNVDDDESRVQVESLYIAQMPIEELPPEMKQLFPAPMDIIKCGKGDIYGSSIWIGNPPTYTPLHKDPNPNIFTQHSSSKIIRLLQPKLGTALFYHLQNQLGTQSSASFRGEEMMEGDEFHALENSIWNSEELGRTGLEHYETVVGPGESLFIPKGWWHSIKSVGKELNMSVNWWFR